MFRSADPGRRMLSAGLLLRGDSILSFSAGRNVRKHVSPSPGRLSTGIYYAFIAHNMKALGVISALQERKHGVPAGSRASQAKVKETISRQKQTMSHPVSKPHLSLRPQRKTAREVGGESSGGTEVHPVLSSLTAPCVHALQSTAPETPATFIQHLIPLSSTSHGQASYPPSSRPLAVPAASLLCSIQTLLLPGNFM